MITLAEVAGLFQFNNADDLELFNNAVSLFEKYQVPGYLEVFDATISASIDGSDLDVIASLKADIASISENILLLQGIQVVEDVLLSDLLELADVTRDIVYHEDRQAVEIILDMPESSEEIFARLIELRSGQPVEKTLTLIESVSNNIPEMVREMMTHHDEGKRVDAENEQIVAVYKNFKATAGADVPLMADAWIRQSATIGLDMGFYVDQYLAITPLDLTAPTPAIMRSLALELYAAACLSFDGYATPHQSLKSQLEKVFPDVILMTQLDIALSKISMECTQ